MYQELTIEDRIMLDVALGDAIFHKDKMLEVFSDSEDGKYLKERYSEDIQKMEELRSKLYALKVAEPFRDVDPIFTV